MTPQRIVVDEHVMNLMVESLLETDPQLQRHQAREAVDLGLHAANEAVDTMFRVAERAGTWDCKAYTMQVAFNLMRAYIPAVSAAMEDIMGVPSERRSH